MSTSDKTQAGFSLLEVLIAFVIFAIAVVALGRVQGLFLINENIAEQKAEATNLAHAKIEQFRSYTSLTGSGNSYANIASGNESVVGRNTTFTLTWVVGEITTPPYKTVDVSVTWVAQDGASRTITLSSIIGKINPASVGNVIQLSQAGGVTPP